MEVVDIGTKEVLRKSRDVLYCTFKLGTRPRSFISGNICFEFSVQCVLTLNFLMYEENFLLCFFNIVQHIPPYFTERLNYCTYLK
jgi:hypothetical protein